jgi:hypothetical protein
MLLSKQNWSVRAGVGVRKKRSPEAKRGRVDNVADVRIEWPPPSDGRHGRALYVL